MTKLFNEITINAPTKRIWDVLSNLEELDQYDPTVKRSVLVTTENSGLEAKRKVDMKDGKNWFEEKVIEWKPNEALTYQKKWKTNKGKANHGVRSKIWIIREIAGQTYDS